jgi:hypothetical protein
MYTQHNRGTSGIDIDLRRVDIDQCPQNNTSGVKQQMNIFAGTDKCKHRTTKVSKWEIETYEHQMHRTFHTK